jgi:mRNA interferase MazF
MKYQWLIFQADLDPIIGREQAGERPVLVLSAEPLNEHYDVVMVAPITRRKEGRPARLGEVLLPAGTGGLPLESFALCYQVRALDKSRLGRLYGEVSDPGLQEQIQETLADCFDLDRF